MKAHSSPQKPNLFFTLAIGLAVLLFGIVIKSAFAGTSTPVSEQAAKAESEIPAEFPAPIEEVLQAPSAQDGLTGTQPSSSPLASDENQPAIQVKSQIANDIEFTISNYSRVANHFFVDVCYDLPGPGILDINGATLHYGPIKTSNFVFREISLQKASDTTQIGRRCTNLDFPEIFTSEKSKTFTLSIEWLGLTNPSEGHECEEYLARGKETLAQQGIVLQCNTEPGSFSLTVASKPETMSQAQLDDLLSKSIYGVIKGPWTFNGTVEN